MKQIASISLDLDNQWSYMRTHGDEEWKSFPSYLDVAVPRILAFLQERDLKITFFIVGQDAALEKNHAAIRSIAEAGHEIANHSFNHEPWLHLYSRDELVEEFERTEAALETVTGARPVGFRGPGFSLSPTVLEVLGERGYEYDCSTLPTYIAPLARAFFFLRSPDVTEEEREKLKKLFGKFSDGFRTLRPHSIKASDRRIVEIPVTTFPVVKIPIHASYLMFLFKFSPFLARTYWKMAVTACRVTGVQPSLLLHPLDFLCGDDVTALRFFPGMNVPAKKKVEFLNFAIRLLSDSFDIVNMREHAEHFRRNHRSTSEELSLERA
ncbi:MAG: polysaccharide deacetylase family protein [Pyrinomonadaceae bacterium]|nr:polysaccharide deacetylase family protein [Pyrinomonadaceae bacterium]MBP6213947.1 polysaccharide deacetylase family protein [Pyrinomonadaceae bacterium]